MQDISPRTIIKNVGLSMSIAGSKVKSPEAWILYAGLRIWIRHTGLAKKHIDKQDKRYIANQVASIIHEQT